MPPKIFKRPGFHILLFCLFLTLFNWPILTIAERHHDQGLFNYLFFAWGLLVLLLLLIGLSLGGNGLKKAMNDREE
jgi:putative effector of murein hydrolase